MLPAETMVAMFPPSARASRGILLKPPTLAHAAALEALGVGLGCEIDPGNVHVAAWLMTMDGADVRELMCDLGYAKKVLDEWTDEHAKASVSVLVRAVKKQMGIALAPYVPCGTKKQNFAPHGFGWPLQLAEAVAHEYGMKPAEAMDTPVSTALALMACAAIRNGAKLGGPDYYERLAVRGIAAAADRTKEDAEQEPGGGKEDGDG